jgi:HPt (histidine-containing phosphotransfer) domain-containing protein
VSLSVEALQCKPAATAQVPVDLERLMEFTDGTPENIRELVTLYLSQTSEQLSKLQQAVRSGSADEVRHLAHSAAGASGTCGVKPLTALLRKLEHQALEQNLVESGPLAEQIASEFERARLFLEEYLSRCPELVAKR